MSIEEKYGIIYINGLRYYQIDLKERRYDFEYSKPLYFRYKNLEIFAEKWTDLILKIVKKLDSLVSKTDEDYLNFSFDWSVHKLFTERETSYNYYFKNNIYLNPNMTALHIARAIRDLLIFYGLDLNSSYLIIRKMSKGEKVEVKTYFKNLTIEAFRNYLTEKFNLKEDSIERYIKNIEYLNKYLNKLNLSYNDLFLIEDKTLLYTLKYKILDMIKAEPFEKSKKTYELAKKCLNIYYDFLKGRINDQLEEENG